MNKKQLFLILAVGAALVVAAYLVSKNRAASFHAPSHAGAKVLKDFDLNAVAKVTMQSGAERVDLVKLDKGWVVSQRENYAADFGKVSGLLRKFWELELARPVQAGASRLPALVLEGPDKGSTVVELRGTGDALIHSVTLGTNVVTQAGEWADNRYLMVDGDPKTISLVNESLAEVDLSPSHWLNPDFIKVDKLIGVAVTSTNAAGDWAVTRDNASADWKLVNAAEGETLDSSKTGTLNNLLSSARFNDVVVGLSDEETGLNNAKQAILKTEDGFVYTLKLGSEVDGDIYLRIALEATLPQEREVGANESDEDKGRLDGEFQARLKRLQSKLETAKKLEGWIYRVPSWTVDALKKVRGDLLKVEEPKEDAKAEVPKQE